MENITDALKMAASVLVFVLALSISITAFGQARRTSQVLLEYSDREYDYSWVENNGNVTKRIVGMETIIPSLYRAYKENYKIIFKFKNNYYLYAKKDEAGNDVKSCIIDLENERFSGDSQKEKFIDIMIYGNNSIYKDQKVTIERETGMTLHTNELYGIIKENKFEESLGIYYQEEFEGKYETPLANRNKKRVITYTQQ